MNVPHDPHQFFTDFFANQFHEDPRYPRRDMSGAAVFQVFDEGAWNFRVQGAQLAVETGKPEDTVLQIGIAADSFRTLFIHRTQGEIDQNGQVSEGSRNVFLPLFFNEAKRRIALKQTETLCIRLRHEKEKHDVLLTPGNGEVTEPRAIVSVSLEDFFGMVARKKKAPFLVLRGKLKVAGDVKYALKMNELLA